jgi:hypothetical protein
MGGTGAVWYQLAGWEEVLVLLMNSSMCSGALAKTRTPKVAFGPMPVPISEEKSLS